MTLTIVTENGQRDYPNLSQAVINKVITVTSEYWPSPAFVNRVQFVVKD